MFEIEIEDVFDGLDRFDVFDVRCGLLVVCKDFDFVFVIDVDIWVVFFFSCFLVFWSKVVNGICEYNLFIRFLDIVFIGGGCDIFVIFWILLGGVVFMMFFWIFILLRGIWVGVGGSVLLTVELEGFMLALNGFVICCFWFFGLGFKFNRSCWVVLVFDEK